MAFMQWVRGIAAQHDDLRGAVVSPDGDWLDILLPDGRTFRFRPAQLIDPNAPETARAERLNRLISIGVKNAKAPEQAKQDLPPTNTPPHNPHHQGANITPQMQAPNQMHPQEKSPSLRSVFNVNEPERTGAKDEEGNPLMLPIVRRADYFLQHHNQGTGDSIVYIPLTDFVAVGLAEDHAERIIPLFFSQFARHGIDADTEGHSLFRRAIDNLRTHNLSGGKVGVVLGVTRVAGAQVLTFTSPEDYQSSWFADVEVLQQVKASIVRDNPDVLPLFIPASRTNLLVVFADDPHLPSFFSVIMRNIPAPDTVYPLPHTLAEDGWREWIPLNDHPAAAVLEKMRNDCRSRAYAAQAQFLRTPPSETTSYGSVKDYEVHSVNGRSVSMATWTDSDNFGSLPMTDFITFICENGSDGEREQVTIRRLVACEVWKEGLKEAPRIWPARLEVHGFPDASTMRALHEAASTRTL
ncbi:MAG: hypothetical protein IKZ87_08535 [Actinomycetaceae bacterium]|nr:hypothetical protein [Actinomycetaceae bacterium]